MQTRCCSHLSRNGKIFETECKLSSVSPHESSQKDSYMTEFLREKSQTTTKKTKQKNALAGRNNIRHGGFNARLQARAASHESQCHLRASLPD